MDLKQFAPAKNGQNNNPVVLCQETFSHLIGLVKIKYVLIDQRPDFSKHEYPQKYKTQIKMYIFGKKVFTAILRSQYPGVVATKKETTTNQNISLKKIQNV